jgi:hypothetical protein
VTDAPLIPFTDGVWLATDPVIHLGLRLTATMTVLRLASGDLLLHSPVAMTPARRAAVEALGPVAHLYAPNTFHHRWIGEWSAASPSAIARPHGAPEPAFAADLDELPIDGFLLHESVLFHRPSRTLVVADLVHNVGRPEHVWTRLYARANGFYDRVALSRMIRWTAFRDRPAARRSLDAVLARPFDRLVVGHGAPLAADAHAALAAAYAWLPAAPP